MYHKYLLAIIAFLLFLSLQAAPGGKLFKEGKALYEQENYQEAMNYFKQAIVENPEQYNSKGNYMIALCLKKLDRCSVAAVYFKRAALADPNAGGASSSDKFEEQLSACKLSRSQLANITDDGSDYTQNLQTTTAVTTTETEKQTTVQKKLPATTPTPVAEKKKSSSWFWWVAAAAVIGFGGFFFWQQRKQKQEIAAIDESVKDQATQDLYEISNAVFDELMWSELSEKFGEDKVRHLQTAWQTEYAELVENQNAFGIRDLQKKLKILQSNPEKILNSDTTA